VANSRDKGKRGELELRDVLKEYGYEARRGGQQGAGGSADAPDVIHNIPDIHIEVKRVEAFSCVQRAMDQATKDAGAKIPTVWSRVNRKDWLVTMPASAFFSYLLGKDLLK
jgi:Holliday junction resolvase